MEEISRDVVTDATAGDERACRQIIERLHRPVLAMIRGFLGDGWRDRVEDIGQDVFVRIFRSLHRFDGHGDRSFAVWAFAIVFDACRSVARGIDGGPAASLLGNAGARGLDAALSVLDRDHRMAVLLREHAGLSCGEIAQVVGASEPAVRDSLRRAHRALVGMLRATAPAPASP